MCLMMYLGKLQHPRYYIFIRRLYIIKASLLHWASRLLHCEREAFLIKELQTTIFFLGQCNFVLYILIHIARTEINHRALAFTGRLQL